METLEQETKTTVNTNTTEKQILNINLNRIISGLTEIGNLDIDDFDTCLNISKTITNLGVAEKAYGKTLQSVMKKYIQKDEGGNFMTSGNIYLFKTNADKEEYEQEVEALNEKVVTEQVWKIKSSLLSKVKGCKGTTMAKCFELIIIDNAK